MSDPETSARLRRCCSTRCQRIAWIDHGDAVDVDVVPVGAGGTGADVNVQTPLSPFVITPFWPRPGISPPLTRTACACGALIRNVMR
jgi:hypothetical protein